MVLSSLAVTDTSNKLPYTQNWTLDLQFQPSNSWMLEIGYVGNHGTHLVLPIPFNQPLHRHGNEWGERADDFLRGYQSAGQPELLRWDSTSPGYRAHLYQ